jgi:hypothetical protein
MASPYDPKAAPDAQSMQRVDGRAAHVARLDTSTGSCFCCTSPLACCLFFGTGMARRPSRHAAAARRGAARARYAAAHRVVPALCFGALPTRASAAPGAR